MNTTQHYNFNHLSVKDLVEARDLFHIHLTNKKNVVATAIGRYLVRISDFDKNGNYNPAKKKGKRTLADSIVTSFSWPCILVFVEKWEEKSALIKNDGNDIVPKSLYMPDGRIVPVCIVEAEKQIRSSSNVDINKFIFPNNYIGGGFPLLLNSQGDERVATVGCVVSDGHKYYALTNRHVTGDGGEKVSSIFGTTKMKIGTSAGNHLGAVKFSQIYPGWEDKSTVVNCDAGLVEIDDRKRWKTDILGLGQMGPLFDLNVNNLSLGIISEHKLDKRRKRITVSGKLKAYGAGTGLMNGEVIAMFYRYKSVGGTEYISDFLIGGINGTDLKVHHGNSGMLWMIEVLNDKNKLELQPLALHWGQHEFISGNQKSRYSYSLSTSLSVICREMNVDLVRGWNLDNDYSWGKVGHYTVAASAILLNAIKDENLKKLLKNNIANIS
ncbi:MAG TPA: hypothetical protein PKN96_12645, partial [Flavobacterium sp.]|uniref:hypothetical protein n=1 Tax=Flavobacterium sp. TaxID=239 RepID=UPI002B589BE5